jgi:hypothetical protein
VLLAGCSVVESPPALLSVSPSEVSALETTDVVATGAHLYDGVRVDLSSGQHPQVRRDWRVRLGDSGADLPQVERVDSETLHFVVPANTAPGRYDVIAFSPLGAAVRLSAGLSVVSAVHVDVDGGTRQSDGGTSQSDGGASQSDSGASQSDSGTTHPVGDPTLSIEDAPGGRGAPVRDLHATTDQTIVLYAVLRDAQGGFVADVEVHWSVSGGIAAAPAGAMSRIALELNAPGQGSVQARDADGHQAALDALQVTTGHARTLEVSPSDADLNAGDDAVQFSVLGRDSDGNATEDLGAITWSIADGTLTSLNRQTGLFKPELVGTGHLRAASSYGVAALSGLIRVRAGALATLQIQPNSATLSADGAPLTFNATGRDAFGNPVSDVGTLTWSIAGGTIGALSSVGVLDPRLAGTGRVRVVSSRGPSAITDDVQITPGQVATLSISPSTLNVMVGDPARHFFATGSDADGNATLDLGALAFSVASGPITALAGDGTFTPLSAGDGTVRVTSSYGISGLSGAIHVDAFAPHVRLSALRLPDGLWPSQDNARMELDVANDSTTDVVLTGAYFTLTNSLSDVSSQYEIRPDSTNSDRVPAGSSITLVEYIDVGYPVNSGTLRVGASVDAFYSTGVLTSPSISNTLTVYSTTLGPTITLTAPVAPANRLCKGGSAAFSCTTTRASSPIFAWLFPSGSPASSTLAAPSVQYTQVGAFDYAVTVTDAWGLHNTALAGKPIFVGEALPAAQSYPTGNIAFSVPGSGLNVDMAALPRSDLISSDSAQALLQCDGTPVDSAGARYVTLFVDRGRIDPNEDDHPELPGIQVDLSGQGSFSSIKLQSSDPQLEGPATLYGEFSQPGTSRVTAAGYAAFQMTNDQQAPRVTASLPSADCGVGCYPKAAPFVFRFSEPISASSLSNVKVERLNGTSCTSSVFSDLSSASTKTYDAASRTLFVTPGAQISSSYLLRVTLGSQLTDAAATPNALVPLVRCVGVTAQSAPAAPQPAQASLSASVFSPDGDGLAETLTWNVTVDAATRYFQLRVLRGATVVWSQTEIVPAAGSYPITWDGRDSSGRSVFNGFYRYDIVANNASGVAAAAISGAVQVDGAAHQVGVRRRF